MKLDGTVTSRVALLPNTLAIEGSVREVIHYNPTADTSVAVTQDKGQSETSATRKCG